MLLPVIYLLIIWAESLLCNYAVEIIKVIIIIIIIILFNEKIIYLAWKEGLF
jgi:hypothetical protein